MPTCQVCGSSSGHILPEEWGTFCIPCLEKSKLCDACNTIHPVSNVLVVGNQILCASCAGNAVNCSKCGALHVDSLRHRGKNYCPKCASEFSHCSVCGKIHLKIKISDMDKLQYSLSSAVCSPCLENIKATVTPIEVLTCIGCGCLHTDKTELEGTPCKSCIENHIVCVGCGKVSYRVYGRNHGDTHVGVCDACAHSGASNWAYCNICNKYYSAADMDDCYCKECSRTRFLCPICDCIRDRRKASVVDDTLICWHCSENVKCKYCGKQTLHSEAGYCYDCCDSRKIIRVNNYSFKPRFRMFGNGIHLGVENEIAFVDEVTKKFLSSVPRSWMYMKSDSSVEQGVECVFHPTTLAYFQQNKKILDRHFECNIKPHKSAGMHVHLSKDKFGTYQLFKFIQFFKDHVSFIDKIAGRSGNTYARPIVGKCTEITKMAKKNESAERYRAININNEKTIEVRIFAGVVNTKDFMKNIEFCDALYNFTKTSPHFKGGKIQVSYFVAYVNDYKHMYPNLNVFLGGTPPKEKPGTTEHEPQPDIREVISACVDNLRSLELREGARVHLTSMESSWSLDEYNPLVDTPFFCEGTVTRYSDNWMGCNVLWDNNHSNCYDAGHLTVVG